MPPIVSAALPVFLIWNVWAALVLLIGWLPKFFDSGPAETVGATPLPLRAMWNVPPGSSLAMSSVASFCAPVEVGLKASETMHDCPAFSAA